MGCFFCTVCANLISGQTPGIEMTWFLLRVDTKVSVFVRRFHHRKSLTFFFLPFKLKASSWTSRKLLDSSTFLLSLLDSVVHTSVHSWLLEVILPLLWCATDGCFVHNAPPLYLTFSHCKEWFIIFLNRRLCTVDQLQLLWMCWFC